MSRSLRRDRCGPWNSTGLTCIHTGAPVASSRRASTCGSSSSAIAYAIYFFSRAARGRTVRAGAAGGAGAGAPPAARLGHGADEEVVEPGPPVGADDDQAVAALLGDLEDLVVRQADRPLGVDHMDAPDDDLLLPLGERRVDLRL